MLAIMQASLTGGGLVIAIYSIVGILRSEMISRRMSMYPEILQRLTEIKTQTSEPSGKLQKLSSVLEQSSVLDQMDTVLNFPFYFNALVALSFVLHIAATLMCVYSLNQGIPADLNVTFVFVIATVCFVALGFAIIVDFYRIMNEETKGLKAFYEGKLKTQH